jgi:hypothetical protein
MVRWPIVAALDGGRALTEHPGVSKWLLRSPFSVALSASLGGALIATAGDIKLLSAFGAMGRFTVVLACSLLLVIAASRAFQVIGDPYLAPVGRIAHLLRAFHARAGRHRLDGAWLEVLLASALLLAGPLAALLAHSTLRVETALLFGAAICAVRKPLVDFEHGDSHYAFLRGRPQARRWERAVLATLDWLVRYPFAVITARIPNWYAVQHVAVHHAENNGVCDNQSTAPYDRATFSGFAVCLQRFAFSGLFPADVALYLFAKRRLKPLRRLCLGYAVYVSFLWALAAYSLETALFLVAIRYASLLADGASFFQEHGLLDPDHPEQVTTNSLHYMNQDNEHGSRGEDLHVEHHRRPGVHWTRYPEQMSLRCEEYERLHAIGFHDGPGQLEAYYRCLWRRDFAELATHVHVFGGERMAGEDIINLLKRRTAPAGRDRIPISALEARWGRLGSWLI